MAYTVTVGAEFDAGVGVAQSPTLPSGTLTNKLLVLVTCSATTAASKPATPSGYTLLGSLDTTDPLAVFGKIAGASESAPSLNAWGSGASCGFMLAIASDTGSWPAIGSILASGTNPTASQPGNGTQTRYSAHTVLGNGNCLLRISQKNGTLSGTPTAVDVNSGYTAAGFANRATSALCSGEMLTAVTSVGSNATDADTNVTGDTGSTNRSGLTFEFVPAAATITITVDDDTPTPTQAIVITKTGNWSGTPTATLTDNNGTPVAMPALTSVSGAVATLTLGAGSINNYDDSNATWELIRWNQVLTLTVTDSAGSGSDTITITPPVDDHFDALGSSGVYVTSPGTTGDDSYVHIVSGDGEGLPVLADLQGNTVPTVARFLCFDISADKWLAQIEHTFDVAAAALDGEYADAFTGTNGTLITAHTPDADVVGGGYTIEKDLSTKPTVTGAVDIQSNTVRINDANEGFVVDVGTTEPDFSFDWVIQSGGTGLEMIAQIRRLDDTEHVHLYVQQSGLIRVNERVASANIGVTGTNETTFSGGFIANNSYRFRFVAVGSLLSVYVDDVLQVQCSSTRTPASGATNVGLFAAGAGTFPVYFDDANVYSDYTDLSLSTSLTSQEYAPFTPYRNALKWSNGFGNAVHTKTRASTVWTTGVTDSFGRDGVWKLVEDSTASNTHLIALSSVLLVAGQQGVVTAYVKTAGRSFVAIQVGTGSESFGALVPFAYYNVITGASSSASSATTSFTDAGNGWLRIELVTIAATATASVSARIKLANTTPSDSYSGNGTDGVYICAAQFEIGTTPTPYIHTEHVPLRSDQVIVRAEGAHNLVPQSNTLSNAAWTKTRSSIGASLTLTGSATGGWAGVSIPRILDTTDNNTHFVVTATDAVGVNPAGLVSMRFLAAGDGTINKISVFVYGDTTTPYIQYLIDLTDGSNDGSSVAGTAALHSLTVTQVDTVSARPVYEIIIRGWCSTTSDTALNKIEIYAHNGTSTTYIGTGSQGPYVGKIQVVSGYDLPDYVETTTADPLFASNVNAATLNGVSQGVALDAIIQHTEDQTQTTPWARVAIAAVTAEGVSADGYPAYKIDGNTTDTAHALGFSNIAKTVSDSTLLTGFCDYKADERTVGRLLLRDKASANHGRFINLSTGALLGTTGSPTASEIQSRGGGWYRVRVVINVSTGGATPAIRISPCEADGDEAYPGNVSGNDGLLVSRCFAVEGNIAMADADAAYVRAGSTMEYVRDKSSAIVTMPAIEDFDAAGTHVNTLWNRNVGLAITDGTETATGTIQVVPPVAANFGTVGSGPYGYAPVGTTSEDECYVHVVSGAGTASPSTVNYVATEASVVRFMVADTVSESWRAYLETNIGVSLTDLTSIRPYLSISLGI